MSRQYVTQATMLHDKFSDKIVQPTLHHVDTLHRLLDMIPADSLAMSIDHVVADLIKFHRPPKGYIQPELILPKKGQHK